MTWQLGLVASLGIAVPYFLISGFIVRGLIKARQVTSNALGLGTALIRWGLDCHVDTGADGAVDAADGPATWRIEGGDLRRDRAIREPDPAGRDAPGPDPRLVVEMTAQTPFCHSWKVLGSVA